MNTVVSVNEFDNGMVGDNRSTSTNVWSLLKGFDPVSRKHRATPYHSTQSADSAPTTHAITDFISYPGGVGTLFGLGVVNDSGGTDGHVQIWTKDSLTSGSGWSTFANSTSASHSNPVRGFFVQYHGYAYCATSTGNILKIGLGGEGLTESDATLSNDPTCNGIVHSKDDILYVGGQNIISKNNNGTWTTAALTLPSRYTISCLAEFNDYLAIGCNGTDGKSVVYLWDRNSSLTTLSENLDWGSGSLTVLAQVEEYLIGVSTVSTSGLYPKMVFRRYLSGSGGVVFNEFFASTTVGLHLKSNSSKANNRLYFAGGITLNNTRHDGIWAIQRPANGTEFSVWLDKLPDNDTAIDASTMQGFIHINDYVYISYRLSTAYAMSFTNSNATAYSSTSYAQTTINPNMPTKDRTKNKQLKAVAVSTVPLGVDGGKVVLSYRVDGGSWTSIISNTTNSVTSEAVLDATGTAFTSGREYEFQVKCGGVSGDATELTEFKYSYEILETVI